MVSVALLVKPFGPIPRPLWPDEQRSMAQRIARDALAGDGIESTDVPDDGEITFIIRRQCRDDERRRVTEKYLKI